MLDCHSHTYSLMMIDRCTVLQASDDVVGKISFGQGVLKTVSLVLANNISLLNWISYLKNDFFFSIGQLNAGIPKFMRDWKKHLNVRLF